MFRIGQKVVCVDDTHTGTWTRQWLTKNEVYTVSGFNAGNFYNPRGYSGGITLFEVTGKPTGFGIERFSPVVERKTSIEIFTRMLTPNKRERVDSL